MKVFLLCHQPVVSALLGPEWEEAGGVGRETAVQGAVAQSQYPHYTAVRAGQLQTAQQRYKLAGRAQLCTYRTELGRSVSPLILSAAGGCKVS